MAAASDSDQERNLPPTARRLEQAREEGQIPRSRALSHLAVIGTAAGALWLLGPSLVARYTTFLSGALKLERNAALDSAVMTSRLSMLTWEAMLVAVPVVGLLALAGAAAAPALGGWVFTWKPVTPNFGRVNPLAGFQRILSYQSLTELAKVLIEAAAVVVVVAGFLWMSAPEFASVVLESQDGGLASTQRLVVASILAMALALALAAIVDVPLQLWKHHHSLRMSLEEIKREARESEGDPQLRARIRSVQREMARKRMMEEVPKADVVITNPTHFAVALAYKEGGDRAPRVVAKGVEVIAQRIREVAGEHRVPVLESPALARALYTHSRLGDPIPQTLYEAVAQVLAYVYRLRAAAAGAVNAPGEFDPIEIPDGLDPQGAVR